VGFVFVCACARGGRERARALRTWWRGFARAGFCTRGCGAGEGVPLVAFRAGWGLRVRLWGGPDRAAPGDCGSRGAAGGPARGERVRAGLHARGPHAWSRKGCGRGCAAGAYAEFLRVWLRGELRGSFRQWGVAERGVRRVCGAARGSPALGLCAGRGGCGTQRQAPSAPLFLRTCPGARCGATAGSLGAPVTLWVPSALGLRLAAPRWHLPTDGCVGLAVQMAKKSHKKGCKRSPNRETPREQCDTKAKPRAKPAESCQVWPNLGLGFLQPPVRRSCCHCALFCVHRRAGSSANVWQM